jgi:hypothetical protein
MLVNHRYLWHPCRHQTHHGRYLPVDSVPAAVGVVTAAVTLHRCGCDSWLIAWMVKLLLDSAGLPQPVGAGCP